MKRLLAIAILLAVGSHAYSQKRSYTDDMRQYQRAYVDSHEVVKGKDREALRFFPVNAKYNVIASFKRIVDTVGFVMRTSGKIEKKFYRYGTLSFYLDKKRYALTLYQSAAIRKGDKYEDYLFLPFTDMTSGDESYGGGRYIDFQLGDIRKNTLRVDFNKAYNPYCAYTTGYNCPIPPRENDLQVKIKAGEKAFGKDHIESAH
jgi:uncharacterized protein (DUF1684 family)